jgi:putative YhbY family RNA-binding protein
MSAGMIELSPMERRALRARSHALRPVVSIGRHGLSPAVLHEIDVALGAHELVKIRVHDDDRDAREALFERVCGELGAGPVQHLGKLLIVYRPKPDAAAAGKPGRATKRKAGGKTARKPSQTLTGRKGRGSLARAGAGAASKKSTRAADVAAAAVSRRRARTAPAQASVALGPDAPRRRGRLAVTAATGSTSAQNEPTLRRRRKNP